MRPPESLPISAAPRSRSTRQQLHTAQPAFPTRADSSLTAPLTIPPSRVLQNHPRLSSCLSPQSRLPPAAPSETMQPDSKAAQVSQRRLPSPPSLPSPRSTPHVVLVPVRLLEILPP